jgi:hypothetical protein
MTKKKKEENIFLEKHALLDNIVYARLDRRSFSFYRRRYSRHMTLSLIFSVVSVFMVSASYLKIIEKNADQKTFITDTFGQLHEYELTETRMEIIRDTIRNHNG